MDINSKITIEFSEEQKSEIMKKCGIVPKPIVTNSLSLIMLSLAATAKKSNFLPLVDRLSTSNRIIESAENDCSGQTPYSVVLELSNEQRGKIKEIVNREWERIVIVPDDYDINFKQIWNSEPPIQPIGESFVIVSEGTEYSPSESEIVIKLPLVNDQNQTTFGTGGHPTTQTVLCLLGKYMKPDTKVADIGTGSGILAVAASKLGAEKVFAIDIDPAAVELAKLTVDLNDLNHKIQIETGNIDLIEDTYDLITANLFPKIISSLAKSLSDKSKTNGILILSGIVSARIPNIIQIMQEVGFEFLESLEIDFWSGAVFRKKI